MIACFVVLGVVFAVAFWRYHDLFQILNGPLPPALKESKPITTEIGEAFTLTILISAYTALLITFPFTLYQLYAYLIPAFSQDTAKRLRPMLLFVPLLVHRRRGVRLLRGRPLGRALPLLLGRRRGQPAAHGHAASTRSR